MPPRRGIPEALILRQSVDSGYLGDVSGSPSTTPGSGKRSLRSTTTRSTTTSLGVSGTLAPRDDERSRRSRAPSPSPGRYVERDSVSTSSPDSVLFDPGDRYSPVAVRFSKEVKAKKGARADMPPKKSAKAKAEAPTTPKRVTRAQSTQLDREEREREEEEEDETAAPQPGRSRPTTPNTSRRRPTTPAKKPKKVTIEVVQDEEDTDEPPATASTTRRTPKAKSTATPPTPASLRPRAPAKSPQRNPRPAYRDSVGSISSSSSSSGQRTIKSDLIDQDDYVNTPPWHAPWSRDPSEGDARMAAHMLERTRLEGSPPRPQPLPRTSRGGAKPRASSPRDIPMPDAPPVGTRRRSRAPRVQPVLPQRHPPSRVAGFWGPLWRSHWRDWFVWQQERDEEREWEEEQERRVLRAWEEAARAGEKAARGWRDTTEEWEGEGEGWGLDWRDIDVEDLVKRPWVVLRWRGLYYIVIGGMVMGALWAAFWLATRDSKAMEEVKSKLENNTVERNVSEGVGGVQGALSKAVEGVKGVANDGRDGLNTWVSSVAASRSTKVVTRTKTKTETLSEVLTETKTETSTSISVLPKRRTSTVVETTTDVKTETETETKTKTVTEDIPSNLKNSKNYKGKKDGKLTLQEVGDLAAIEALKPLIEIEVVKWHLQERADDDFYTSWAVAAWEQRLPPLGQAYPTVEEACLSAKDRERKKRLEAGEVTNEGEDPKDGCSWASEGEREWTDARYKLVNGALRENNPVRKRLGSKKIVDMKKVLDEQWKNVVHRYYGRQEVISQEDADD